jgi:gamma-glutamylcyclotransferase (GGCT)/AIG2-like uncharacterized protein YtfP
MDASHRRLFVYGTLRATAGHRMHEVLSQHAAFLGLGTVRGELYSLGDYPALLPRPDAAALVEGELYEIHADALESALSVLDAYEGLTAADPPPREYRREMVLVVLADGRQLPAWAYVLNRSADGLESLH